MTDIALDKVLFPPITPHQTGTLAVDSLHTLYWEQSGHRDGIPVLFLHGGPGSGTSPRHRQFFNPQHYRIILFDQRGAGRSTPLGEYRANTTSLLISDIEQLRQLLGIEQWLVFGGSWGSTLALAYGQAHPECCIGFILRGIFLCSRREIDWFLYGMENFFPEVYAEFVELLPLSEQNDVLQAYARRLFSDDPLVYVPAARAWSRYEGRCLYLRPNLKAIDEFSADAVSLGVGRLEAHYFLNGGFLRPGQLLGEVPKISHLPATIIQGRYDIVCPPVYAYALHHAWPSAAWHMVEAAGHAGFELEIAQALIAATEQFRLHRQFS